MYFGHISPPPQLLPDSPLSPYPLNFVFSLITNTNNEVQFVLGCGVMCWSLLDLPGATPLKQTDSPLPAAVSWE